MYDVYVITDEDLSNGLSHYETAKLACEGGADVIQLRDKNMGKEELIRAATDIRRITSLHDVLFFVNDHPDVALTSDADGVHLGQGDMKLHEVAGKKNLMIGISASSPEEAAYAERGGADYVGVGPIFATASKHDARPAAGTELLKKVRKAVSIPVVAIGGITKDNAATVIGSGADGVAVISAVVSQKDIKKATEELKMIVSSAKLTALKDRR